MNKKEKIASICLCVSLIILLISSIATVSILKIQKNNIVKELIKKY